MLQSWSERVEEHFVQELSCVCVTDIDTDAVESYLAEETIEFLVNVEESIIDDE